MALADDLQEGQIPTDSVAEIGGRGMDVSLHEGSPAVLYYQLSPRGQDDLAVHKNSED